MPSDSKTIDNATRMRTVPRRSTALLAILCCAAALSWPAGGAHATDEIPVAVADFDYSDSSGEVTDQVKEHQARVAAFGQMVRDSLAASGSYRMVALECPEHPCTAGGMHPDDFISEARRSGARLVVYGGIHKMSTLVQWGEVQLVDITQNQLLLRRTVSFRGDNDAAFRRAAAFVSDTLKDAMPKP